MLTCSELRQKARAQLEGKWGKTVLVYLLFLIIVGAIPGLGLILGGPLLLGLTYYFIAVARNEESEFELLFKGFDNFGKAIGLYLLKYLFIVLWSLLFTIPGIIAAYRYAMAFYILRDEPEIGVSEALTKSSEMMKGHKWQLFVLYLTFIGWGILCIFTMGIGALWLNPYISTTVTNFYEELKNEGNEKEEYTL